MLFSNAVYILNPPDGKDLAQARSADEVLGTPQYANGLLAFAGIKGKLHAARVPYPDRGTFARPRAYR